MFFVWEVLGGEEGLGGGKDVELSGMELFRGLFGLLVPWLCGIWWILVNGGERAEIVDNLGLKFFNLFGNG